MIKLRYQCAVTAQDRINFGLMLSPAATLVPIRLTGSVRKPEKTNLYTFICTERVKRNG